MTKAKFAPGTVVFIGFGLRAIVVAATGGKMLVLPIDPPRRCVWVEDAEPV